MRGIALTRADITQKGYYHFSRTLSCATTVYSLPSLLRLHANATISASVSSERTRAKFTHRRRWLPSPVVNAESDGKYISLMMPNISDHADERSNMVALQDVNDHCEY
jgi:hypothetical protein